jgi:hypothetical protein
VSKKQGVKGRFSARKKTEAVLRLLRGEELDVLARELGVTAAKLSEWREAFLAAGAVGLKSREPDARDEEIAKLKAVIGDLTRCATRCCARGCGARRKGSLWRPGGRSAEPRGFALHESTPRRGDGRNRVADRALDGVCEVRQHGEGAPSFAQARPQDPPQRCGVDRPHPRRAIEASPFTGAKATARSGRGCAPRASAPASRGFRA